MILSFINAQICNFLTKQVLPHSLYSLSLMDCLWQSLPSRGHSCFRASHVRN